MPRHKTAWLRIALSLVVLAGVSAALIAVAVGGGSHQATAAGTSAATGGTSAAPGSIKASPVNQAPNSSGTSPAPGSIKASPVHQAPNSSKAAGKFPSAALVAESGGALSLPANLQSRVISWQSGPGGTRLAAVTRLFGDALQAGGIRQYVEMKYSCTQLARSVSTAEAGPQIPVAAMQTAYGQALAELAKGAGDCQAAISVRSDGEDQQAVVTATLFGQSKSELAAGARDIFRSTAEIEIASRQHH
ncbi:MAG: hypothetical protein ABSB01_23475 [Streptosporangiaceae bacterium]